MEYKVYQKINSIWTMGATYYHDDPVLNLIGKNVDFKIEKTSGNAQLALF